MHASNFPMLTQPHRPHHQTFLNLKVEEAGKKLLYAPKKKQAKSYYHMLSYMFFSYRQHP